MASSSSSSSFVFPSFSSLFISIGSGSSSSPGRNSPSPRTPSPLSRSSTPDVYGEELSEKDQSNLQLIHLLYKNSRKGQTGVKLEEKEGVLIIATSKKSDRNKITKSSLKVIKGLVSKVSQPLIGYSDPTAVGKGLFYYNKLQRWLPVVVGEKAFRGISFPVIEKSVGGPFVTQGLTGNGFLHWKEYQENAAAWRGRRIEHETNHPEFYDEEERVGLKLISAEIAANRAELALFAADGMVGPMSLEDYDRRTHLEVLAIPRLEKILDYHFILFNKIETLLGERDISDPEVQNLLREKQALLQIIQRKSVPLGSGVNNPMINYANSSLIKTPTFGGGYKVRKQLLGIEVSNLMVGTALDIPVSIEKPSTDPNFSPEESDWAGTNEMLAFHLDEFFGGYFNVPACAWSFNPFFAASEDIIYTLHAYVKNKGTAKEFEEEKKLTLNGENLLFLELFICLVNGVDAHEGNFLVKKDYSAERMELIPIDFGRMLLADPLSHDAMLRSSVFIKWLNQIPSDELKFSEKHREVFCKVKPEDLAVFARKIVGYDQMGGMQRNIWDQKILHLQANLVLIQVALKNNLSPKEMFVLKMPNIGVDFVTQKIVDVLELIKADKEAASDPERQGFVGGFQGATLLADFRKISGINSYFDHAWNICSSQLPKLSDPEFLALFEKVLAETLHKVSQDVELIFYNPMIHEMLENLSL